MTCRNATQMCALVVLLLIEARSSLATTQEDLVKYCLAGIKASRAQIQSGELIATGKMTGKEPKSTQVIPALPVELHIDFDSQKLRFERKEGDFDGTVVREIKMALQPTQRAMRGLSKTLPTPLTVVACDRMTLDRLD
jgi:hypothetical protein